jgi:hypothetical protein
MWHVPTHHVARSDRVCRTFRPTKITATPGLGNFMLSERATQYVGTWDTVCWNVGHAE